MSAQPPVRIKRAILKPAAKGNVTVINGKPVGGGSRAIPDADSASPGKSRDPIAGHAFAAGLGFAGRKSVGANRTVFDRAPAAGLFASAIGVTRRAPSITYAYIRADATHDVGYLQKFADAGAHEARREGRSGRNILRGLVNALNKGDVLLVERLTDIAAPKDLPKAIQEIEGRGIILRSLDGADSGTPAGRGKIANAVMASKALFGGLRL